MEKNLLNYPIKELELNNKEQSNNSTCQEYIKILIRYAKARWLIFNFPWATFVALMIAYDGEVDIPIAILTVSSSYMILLATYTYNDALDLEVDKVNDPNRPLASGRATKKDIIRLTWILNGIALVMAILVNIQVFIVASTLVILGILYSHPKTSFKDRFPYKTLVTSFGAMLASFLGGFANNYISLNVIYAGISFFIFCTVLALLGDISDIKGDKASGRRTLPIIIGQKNTAIVIYGLLILMITLTIVTYNTIELSLISLTLAISTCILSIIKLKRLLETDDIKKIKMLRPPMRMLSFSFQLVLLLAIFL